MAEALNGTWSAGDMFGESLRIERILGRGGSGTVYLASDIWLGRKVAVKVLGGALAGHAEVIGRFKREAQALARVRSDHVARAYAMGVCVFGSASRELVRSKETCWLAMEYVEGASLGTIIEEHRAHGVPIPVHRALDILRQIAHGLAAVHRCRLVHRDVKPFNIVIEAHTGRPVLVDFGLVADEGDKPEAVASGTASYMPPEQAGLGPGQSLLTGQSDIYALGCTAFELLTGRVPFNGETAIEVVVKHAIEEAPRLSTLRPDLSAFDEVLARMLAKDPSSRYASCDALVASFDAALRAFEQRPTLSPPPMPPARSQLVPTDDLDDAVRILVVDDDPAFRRLVVTLIRAHFDEREEHEDVGGADRRSRTRVQLVEASSGEAALATAAEACPDLTLLDLDMPGLDGIETLTRLRQLPRGATTRVLVISSRVTESERWRFSVLGVSDFLGKPVAPAKLTETVARMVGELTV